MKGTPSSEDLRASLRAYELTGAAVVFLLTVVIFGWSTLAAIASAVIAPGVVAVSGQAKQVQHLEGGIVSQILVKNADVVEAGAVLMRFDQTEANASQQIVARQIDELTALRARLKAELDNAEALELPPDLSIAVGAADLRQTWSDQARLLMASLAKGRTPEFGQMWSDQARLLASRREARLGKEQQFSDRIAQNEQVVVGLDAQQKSLEQQLALIRDELKGLEKLEVQQLVPKTKVAALRRELARLDGQRGQHVAEIARTQVQISETKTQLAEYRQQVQTELLAELRDTEAKLSEAREKEIAISARLQRLTVVAPQAGVVHKLSVNTLGGVVAPGQTILEIVPQEEKLVFEGRLDPAYVDQVAAGQTVGIRLVALDQNKTPEVDGVLSSVAPDVRQDNPNSPPYYAITVRMDEVAMADIPGRLVPGMPVELLIRGADRTVFAYLVKPLTDRFAHTFREN